MLCRYNRHTMIIVGYRTSVIDAVSTCKIGTFEKKCL